MKHYMQEPEDWSKEMWKMNEVEPAVWVPVEIETGRIEADFHQFDDDLTELCDGWEWRRFLLVPESNDELTLRNGAERNGGSVQ